MIDSGATQYHILYAPGSGGVFLSNIFLSYLGYASTLTLNSATGASDATNQRKQITLGHSVTDAECNTLRKLVAITYNPDDQQHLQTMNFYKYFKPLITNPKNYNLIVEKWGETYIKKMLLLDDAGQKKNVYRNRNPKS